MLKVTVNWASWKVKDVHDMMLALLASFRGHLRPLPGVGEGCRCEICPQNPEAVRSGKGFRISPSLAVQAEKQKL